MSTKRHFLARIITSIAFLAVLSGCKIASEKVYFNDGEGVALFQHGTVATQSNGDVFTITQLNGKNSYHIDNGTSLPHENVTIIPMDGYENIYIAQDQDSILNHYYVFEVRGEREVSIYDFPNKTYDILNVEINHAVARYLQITGRGDRATLLSFFSEVINDPSIDREKITLDKPVLTRERMRQIEQEQFAASQANRLRLMAEQDSLVKNKEKKVISFSDGTELAFCISDSTIEAAIKAASEQNYFVYINRLDSLNKERLCTRRLSMENIEEMTAAVEHLEKDDDTGRVFMIGSIARNYFTNCPPCDDLRPSDRLYFVTYNEVGGDQYGWKGYEQFIVNSRTVGGIMDFLLSE